MFQITPLVRAVVRIERIKRAYGGPATATGRRAIELRTRLLAQMTPAEERAAAELCDADRIKSRRKARV